MGVGFGAEREARERRERERERERGAPAQTVVAGVGQVIDRGGGQIAFHEGNVACGWQPGVGGVVEGGETEHMYHVLTSDRKLKVSREGSK